MATDASSDYPDYQVFFTPMVIVEDPRERGMQRKKALPGFQLDVNQMHPDSHGTLKLRSADPKDHPVLDPRYLSEEKDRKEMVAAVKWARELAGSGAVAGPEGDNRRRNSRPGGGERKLGLPPDLHVQNGN